MTTPLVFAARWIAAGLSTLALASAACAAGPSTLDEGITALTASSPSAQIFKAKMAVIETVNFTGGTPCFGFGAVQGSGTSTPLGKFTANSQDCINPLGVFDPSSPRNSFSFATLPAGMVMMAANGDRLFISYSGTLTPSPSGQHQVAGYFVITGGTGKYAKATGGGILLGQEDLSQVVSLRGEINALGTITY
jgi:hypothetical protein